MTTYAAQAAAFEAWHGFPAPPEDLMKERADWPVPFCQGCRDWHEPSEPCSVK